MTTVAVIQARTGSSRLPGKVLLPLAGAPALQRMGERVQTAQLVDSIVVATTIAPGDDALEALCSRLGVDCVRGPVDDVLARFALVATTAAASADRLVRLTADCPLVAPDLVDAVVGAAASGDYDYASNVSPPTWPDGLDVEVLKREVLLEADATAVLPSDREHVTPWVQRSKQRQHTSCAASATDLSRLRWTLDEPEDYVLIAAVYSALHARDDCFTTADVLDYLQSRPEIAGINARFARNEGYRASLASDPSPVRLETPRG
jgi:spore coat polysaccharide biosynthesis protein SpsF